MSAPGGSQHCYLVCGTESDQLWCLGCHRREEVAEIYAVSAAGSQLLASCRCVCEKQPLPCCCGMQQGGGAEGSPKGFPQQGAAAGNGIGDVQ